MKLDTERLGLKIRGRILYTEKRKAQIEKELLELEIEAKQLGDALASLRELEEIAMGFDRVPEAATATRRDSSSKSKDVEACPEEFQPITVDTPSSEESSSAEGQPEKSVHTAPEETDIKRWA